MPLSSSPFKGFLPPKPPGLGTMQGCVVAKMKAGMDKATAIRECRNELETPPDNGNPAAIAAANRSAKG